MASSTLPGLLLTGTHAARPAANTVGSGALYACSTHSLIYQSDASSWSTWATLTGTGLSDPMTTRGDIIIRDASNVTARLGRGSANQVLTSDGTDVAWQTPSAGSTASYAKAYATGTQNLSAATLTVVTFDAEENDTDTYHSTVTNTGRFTVPSGKDGVFVAIGYVFTGINGVFLARWRKNGTTAIRGQTIVTNSNTTGGIVVTTGPIPLVATDYLELQAYLASGGNIGDATNAEQQCFGSLYRIGS